MSSHFVLPNRIVVSYEPDSEAAKKKLAKKIIEAVAHRFAIAPEDITRRSTAEAIFIAKLFSAIVVAEMTGWSKAAVCRALRSSGNFLYDHSEKIVSLSNRPRFRAMIEEIKRTVMA